MNHITPLIILIILFFLTNCSIQVNGSKETLEKKSIKKKNINNLQRIPGTGIYMEIPKSFILEDPHFKSYFTQPGISNINVMFHKIPYEEIKISSNWEFYKNEGEHKLISETPIKISGLKGHSLEVTFNNKRSIQINVGDKEQTFQIFGTCSIENNSAKKELENIFKSICIDKNFDIPWQDLAGFRLNEKYNHEFKITKDLMSSRYEFKTNSNLTIDIVRILDLPNRKDSKTILLEDSSEGWRYRKGIQIPNELISRDTTINSYKSKLINVKCKEKNANIELIQLIIEGEIERILLTCRIRNNFDKSKILVYDFIDNILIE